MTRITAYLKTFNIISIFLISISLLSNCHDERERATNNKIRIEFEKLPLIGLEELLNGIQIIPLELTKNSAINRVSDLIIFDDQICILDVRSNSIFVFDKFGRFKERITNIGKGPGEYLTLSSIGINRYNGNIELLDPTGRFIDIALGKGYKSVIPLEFRSVHNFVNVSKDIILFYSKYDEYQLQFYSRKSGKKLKEMWLNKSYNLNTIGHIRDPFYIKNDSCYFIDDKSNSVYSIKDTTLELKISFDFGRHTVDWNEYPKEYSNPPDYYMDYMINNNLAYPIVSFFESLGILVVYYNGHFKSLHLNKVYSEYEVKEIRVGYSIHSFIPFFSMSNENKLYGLIVEPDSINAYIPDNFINEKNKNILSNVNATGNPLLIEYHFK